MLRCVRASAAPLRTLRALRAPGPVRWQVASAEDEAASALSSRRDLPQPKARMNVPPDAYLYGFTAEDLADAPEAVKRALSVHNGSDKDVLKYRIAKCVDFFGDFERDSGNTRVQVAIDTMKVQHLREHTAGRPKDQDAHRTLQRVLNHRRTMLRYLKRTDLEGYLRVVKTLGLADNVQAPPKLHHKKITRKRA